MFRLLDKAWFLKYRYYIILIIWLWNNTSQYLVIRFEGDLTFISKPTILMLTRGTGFRPAESIPHFDVTCHPFSSWHFAFTFNCSMSSCTIRFRSLA